MSLSTIEDRIETGARKPREYQQMEPVYIRRLCNKLPGGQKEAANLIGVTATTISAYLQENIATKPMELAAKGLWYELFGDDGKPKEKLVTAIVRGELHHLKTFQDMITNLGGTFSFVDL